MTIGEQKHAVKSKRPPISTVLQVEALKAEAKEYSVKDAKTEGLWLTVKPSGVKSWVLFYRLKGPQKKLTLGPVGLAEARKKAAEARILISEGMDPASAKRAYKAAQAVQPTRIRQEPPAIAIGGHAVGQGEPILLEQVNDRIEDVVARFIAEYAKPNTRDWQETQRTLEKNVVTPWRGRRLSEIGAADFYLLLDQIAERAPIGANRVHAQLSVMCKWAASRKVGLTERNVFDGIEKPTSEKGRARERTLKDHELRLIWRAAETLGAPFGPLVQLLILTGQRRNEVAGMNWQEIDMAESVWRIPAERAKNGRAHELPLSAQVLAILESLPRIARKASAADYVLTANDSPPSGFSKAKRRLDKAIAALNGGAPIESWTLHDLRRTVATGLAKLGVELHVIERCLNHVSGSFSGIVGVYQKHKYEDQMRDALNKWAAHVEAVVGGEGRESNAVELATARPAG